MHQETPLVALTTKLSNIVILKMKSASKLQIIDNEKKFAFAKENVNRYWKTINMIFFLSKL